MVDILTVPATTNRIFPLPKHVAVIMDGNGRWAKQRGLPRLAGHRAGTDNIRRVVEDFDGYQVKYLTLYAFSTENWSRPRAEVRGLLRILGQVIDREIMSLHEKGVKLRYLGRLDGLSKRLQAKVSKAVKLTRNNTNIGLSLAFNYGGRAEILDTIRRIVKEGVAPEDITESLFSSYLYISDIPDPDLIIRTAGEMRLSNFLIWQGAYSEYYSTPTLWPDFGEKDIENALVAYSQRERRFGGLKSGGKSRGRPGD